MATPDDKRDDKLATILELGERGVEHASRHQLAIERFIRAIARPASLYVLVAVCVAWVLFNLIATSAFDPSPFPRLQDVLTLYAAIVATCVLVAQSREKLESERRANLDLHVNLVAEQKATKIIALLEELRRDLPNVRDRTDSVANDLQKEVDARAVHSALVSEDE